METNLPTEGWIFPGDARKAHYAILVERVAGDRAGWCLCGHYGFIGPRAAEVMEVDNGPSTSDAAGCRRKFEARQKKLEAASLHVSEK